MEDSPDAETIRTNSTSTFKNIVCSVYVRQELCVIYIISKICFSCDVMMSQNYFVVKVSVLVPDSLSPSIDRRV